MPANNNEPSIDLTHFFYSVYEDRQMIKWTGFVLSEHTESIKQDEYHANYLPPRLDRMTEQEMFQVYEEALLTNQPITIQQNKLTIDLTPSPLIRGFIQGLSDTGIFINHQFILFEDIQNISLTTLPKWFDET